MMEKKKFLLRLDPRLYAGLQAWAADELRSLNAQIEWALKEALRARRGASRKRGAAVENEPSGDSQAEAAGKEEGESSAAG